LDLHSTAGRVATGQVGSHSGMVAQGPDSNWAPGPSCQGHNRSAVVVLLVGQPVVRLEWVTLEMVLRVLAESVASGAVAPIALLARLGCMSVPAGVRPKKGNGGQMGRCLESRSSAGMYTDTPPPPA